MDREYQKALSELNEQSLWPTEGDVQKELKELENNSLIPTSSEVVHQDVLLLMSSEDSFNTALDCYNSVKKLERDKKVRRERRFARYLGYLVGVMASSMFSPGTFFILIWVLVGGLFADEQLDK